MRPVWRKLSSTGLSPTSFFDAVERCQQSLTHLAGCSECIEGSPLRGEVSLEECPTQCEATLGEVKSNFQVILSEKQTRYARNVLAFHTRTIRDTPSVVDTTILQNETAIIRNGAKSLCKCPPYLFFPSRHTAPNSHHPTLDSQNQVRTRIFEGVPRLSPWSNRWQCWPLM